MPGSCPPCFMSKEPRKQTQVQQLRPDACRNLQALSKPDEASVEGQRTDETRPSSAHQHVHDEYQRFLLRFCRCSSPPPGVQVKHEDACSQTWTPAPRRSCLRDQHEAPPQTTISRGSGQLGVLRGAGRNPSEPSSGSPYPHLPRSRTYPPPRVFAPPACFPLKNSFS